MTHTARSLRILSGFFSTFLLIAPAWALQDDVPVPLDPPDRFLSPLGSEGTHGLSATHGAMGLGIYPLARGFHFWHGHVAGDVTVLAFGSRSAFHMGLSTQTIADARSTILFRLVRLFYEATALFDYRLGPGVLTVGYRHRCTHGTDDAEEGRILFRSGPEVSFAAQRSIGPDIELTGSTLLHVTLVGQNLDPNFKPRVFSSVTGQARWRHNDVSLFASAGMGLAVVGDQGDFDYTLADPIGHARTIWLPTAAAGVTVHGEAATLSLFAHLQRILDSGFGLEGAPTTLLSIEPQLRW